MGHMTPRLLLCLSILLPAIAWAQNEDGVKEVDADTGFEVEFSPAAVDEPVTSKPGPGIVNFSGLLRERGTRAPVAEVTVYLVDTEFEAVSDAQGRFEFRGLPSASYTVVIPTTTFELFETDVEIRPGELTEANLYLEPMLYGGLEVVVSAKRVDKEVSRKVLKMEEVKLIPGTNGDAVKVVQNLPGVARTAGGLAPGGVVIRGSSPEDSRILLDGHLIPNLFHFGGLKSVYNSDLLSEVNLYTGAYGAQNGGATGGVVELKSRAPRSDRWGGYVDSSFLDASALVEGPVTEDMGLALAVRRSTLDLLLPLTMKNSADLSFTVLPVYYDYQTKLDYLVDEHNSLRVDVYGAYDELALASKKVSDGDPAGESSAFAMQSMFHAAYVTHRYQNDWFESRFSPGYAYITNRYEFGKDFYFEESTHAVSILEDMRFKLAKSNTLLVGARLFALRSRIDGNIIRPPKESDENVSFSNDEVFQFDIRGRDVFPSVYIADEMQLGPVLLVPGMRYTYESLLGAHALSPCINARWSVIQPLVLKVGVGLYHRSPDGDEKFEPLGNTDLEFERALHVLVGAEWAITQSIHLEVTAYYKYMDRLVSRIQDPDSDKAYENGATGESYGGEFLLRHDLTDNLFGWVSYSISRSHRNDGPGTPYRLFDKDQTHNLVGVGSWEFAKSWRIGLRFQYTTGEPYSPVAGSIFKADNGSYSPIFDPQRTRTQRRGAYHTLDLRLDKNWVFDTWILQTYLDVQNVYYHANEIETDHNYDFSEKGQIKGFPIIPSVGLKAEF